MRIGLNATCFNDRPSGAKQRFVEMYGALIRRRTDLDFLVYEPEDCRMAGWFAGAPNVRFIATPLNSNSRWQRSLRGLTYWRSRLRRDRLDVFEMFHLPLVAAPDCPTLLTIHDARPALAGQSWLRRQVGRAVLSTALRRATQTITVSDTMKAELQAIVPAAPIVTITNGIDPAHFGGQGSDRVAATLALLSLPPRFLLAVGHLEPRKNYATLIDAFAALGPDHAALNLVIVGNDSGLKDALKAQGERHGLGDRLRFLHDVGDRDLAALYATCAMLVFVSRYEGFGIPLLEAMAAGRPFLLSDTPVFRELTQGRAVYCDASSSMAIAAAIAMLMADEQRQQALIDYGRHRIADFGFDALSRQVETVYERLLGQEK